MHNTKKIVVSKALNFFLCTFFFRTRTVYMVYWYTDNICRNRNIFWAKIKVIFEFLNEIYNFFLSETINWLKKWKLIHKNIIIYRTKILFFLKEHYTFPSFFTIHNFILNARHSYSYNFWWKYFRLLLFFRIYMVNLTRSNIVII